MPPTAIQRTVLATYAGEATYPEFRIERWFIPIDGPEESLSRIALVWDHADATNESVVLLSPRRALEVATTITTGRALPLP